MLKDKLVLLIEPELVIFKTEPIVQLTKPRVIKISANPTVMPIKSLELERFVTACSDLRRGNMHHACMGTTDQYNGGRRCGHQQIDNTCRGGLLETDSTAPIHRTWNFKVTKRRFGTFADFQYTLKCQPFVEFLCQIRSIPA